MGFVKENITTDEDKARFNEFGFINPATRQPIEIIGNYGNWVIDRKRNFIMTALGGGAHEVPYFFVLILPEGRVCFEGFRKVTGDGPGTQEIWWELIRVDIPALIQSRKLEILDLIKEALNAYHEVGVSKWVKAVHVQTTYIRKTEI